MLLRVGDLFYVGTELEAANRQLLATLGITRVLNCGTPQTRNYFPADPFLRYAAVEVWDNAQSNFAHVFLHEALPFLDESARTRQPTLVHCKTVCTRVMVASLAHSCMLTHLCRVAQRALPFWWRG